MSLEIRNYKKRWSALQLEAGFAARAAERLVLSGPSGSGKTSLFRFIAGLDPEGEGEVRLEGASISGLAPEHRGLGVVFQEPIVFPHLSVIENAAFGLRMRGIGASERRATVLPWLERVGLAGRLDSDPDTLSGGEKQRLALVRAVVWKPRALLLDEPFSALDPGLRHELGRVLLDLHQRLTVPLLLVTHDLEEARRLGTRVLECQILSGSPNRHLWFENR